ncbi:hypothetical protein PAHAL_2G417900 [Panicum hallii]|uniref:Uncharacterized protein n=1 Tax=Panicum hallii TaxID=206008 RepID=A0A2T8KSD0_9POAL|nr:hypothetical protein PAHAL_2G417900 [Panicum hallii]
MVFLASFLFSPSPPSDTLSEEHNTFRPSSAQGKLRYSRQLVQAPAGRQVTGALNSITGPYSRGRDSQTGSRGL